MVRDLLNEEILPPIVLYRCEDGEIQVKDGHHRLTAIWLSGRRCLKDDEYIIIDVEVLKPRFGKVIDLLNRVL